MEEAMHHATVFAGINGTVSAPRRLSLVADDVCASEESEFGQTLFDPTGRWAIQLRALPLDKARCLLQILRDLSPMGTQIDGPFLRRVSAYDEAAATSPKLADEILRDLTALDTLAYRMASSTYTDITERALRRTLLSQMGDRPLMERLGVRITAYAI
jgi:hypothetical protein